MRKCLLTFVFLLCAASVHAQLASQDIFYGNKSVPAPLIHPHRIPVTCSFSSSTTGTCTPTVFTSATQTYQDANVTNWSITASSITFNVAGCGSPGFSGCSTGGYESFAIDSTGTALDWVPCTNGVDQCVLHLISLNTSTGAFTLVSPVSLNASGTGYLRPAYVSEQIVTRPNGESGAAYVDPLGYWLFPVTVNSLCLDCSNSSDTGTSLAETFETLLENKYETTNLCTIAGYETIDLVAAGVNTSGPDGDAQFQGATLSGCGADFMPLMQASGATLEQPDGADLEYNRFGWAAQPPVNLNSVADTSFSIGEVHQNLCYACPYYPTYLTGYLTGTINNSAGAFLGKVAQYQQPVSVEDQYSDTDTNNMLDAGQWWQRQESSIPSVDPGWVMALSCLHCSFEQVVSTYDPFHLPDDFNYGKKLSPNIPTGCYMPFSYTSPQGGLFGISYPNCYGFGDFVRNYFANNLSAMNTALGTSYSGFGSSEGGISYITGFSINGSNIVTFQSPNSLSAGQFVYIAGLQVGTYLDGQILTILSSGLSSSQFEASFTHATVTSTADNGTATVAEQVCAAGTGAGDCGNSSSFSYTLTHTNPTPESMHLVVDISGNFADVSGDCPEVVKDCADASSISFALTAASAASGGDTTYTGTFYTIQPLGQTANVVISGFTNAGNNGTFPVVSATSTSLVVVNSGGVAETHSGKAAPHTQFSGQTSAQGAFGSNKFWQASRWVPAGQVVVDSNNNYEVAGNYGETNGSNPTWNATALGTTTDGSTNSVTETNYGPSIEAGPTRITYSNTGAGTLTGAFAATPPSTESLFVVYTYGGWNAGGTGLLDTAATSGAGPFGTNPVATIEPANWSSSATYGFETNDCVVPIPADSGNSCGVINTGVAGFWAVQVNRTACTPGSTQPSWGTPTIGQLFSDGGCTWIIEQCVAGASGCYAGVVNANATAGLLVHLFNYERAYSYIEPAWTLHNKLFPDWLFAWPSAWNFTARKSYFQVAQQLGVNVAPFQSGDFLLCGSNCGGGSPPASNPLDVYQIAGMQSLWSGAYIDETYVATTQNEQGDPCPEATYSNCYTSLAAAASGYFTAMTNTLNLQKNYPTLFPQLNFAGRGLGSALHDIQEDGWQLYKSYRDNRTNAVEDVSTTGINCGNGFTAGCGGEGTSLACPTCWLTPWGYNAWGGASGLTAANALWLEISSTPTSSAKGPMIGYFF